MRYIWESDQPEAEKVMHILAYTMTGQPARRNGYMLPLCGAVKEFDRSINAPYKLNRPVCEKCRAALQGSGQEGER